MKLPVYLGVDSSVVPCSGYFSVLSDEVVEMMKDNGKADTVPHHEGKKSLKTVGVSLCTYLSMRRRSRLSGTYGFLGVSVNIIADR